METGDRYGRLVSVEKRPSIRKKTYWLFRCDCGIEKVVNVGNVYEGKINSCGCLRVELNKKASHVIHGMRNTRFYRTWIAMRRRCLVESEPAYKNYGGRGITLCEDWNKFQNYMDDMLPSYLEHCDEYGIKQTTLDRINNDGNYEPKNCRWATYKQQANNKRYGKRKN